MAASLHLNSSLRALDFAYCTRLGEAGLGALAGALVKNKAMMAIDLKGCPVTTRRSDEVRARVRVCVCVCVCVRVCSTLKSYLITSPHTLSTPLTHLPHLPHPSHRTAGHWVLLLQGMVKQSRDATTTIRGHTLCKRKQRAGEWRRRRRRRWRWRWRRRQEVGCGGSQGQRRRGAAWERSGEAEQCDASKRQGRSMAKDAVRS